MAKVQGVREKYHGPKYDALFVPATKRLSEVMLDPRMIRFFVDVHNKTKLETNMEAAGVLPSLNSFEARAMRVVVSVPKAAVVGSDVVAIGDTYCQDKSAAAKDDATKLEQAKKDLVNKIQAECDRACIAADSILPELIYNSVTTLLVGEKIMIEMPTFWFPAGAGVNPGSGNINHGEPDPTATFRFAEPVFIEPQQNFRVEMLFPQGLPSTLAAVEGPLRIWVVLDGYLTRDVQ
jgi:hypothetical protein